MPSVYLGTAGAGSVVDTLASFRAVVWWRAGPPGCGGAGNGGRRRVAAPFGDVGLPTIDPANIAETAATVREAGYRWQVYELTGPALTTLRRRAEAIGDAIGEPIRFLEQTRDEAQGRCCGSCPRP